LGESLGKGFKGLGDFKGSKGLVGSICSKGFQMFERLLVFFYHHKFKIFI